MNRKRRFGINFLTSIVCTLLLSLGLSMASTLAFAEEEPAFLPQEKAFVLSAKKLDKDKIELRFHIAPGYVLYREHFQFRTLSGQLIESKAIVYPASQTKKDEALGEYQIYKGEPVFVLSLPTTTEDTGLIISYQGCSEGGFCYSPVAKRITFTDTGTPIMTDISPDELNPTAHQMATTETENGALGTTSSSETDRLSDELKSGNTALTLLGFLGLGLLLAFTPCVLPMVPILANILVGTEAPLSSRRASFLALLYVLSVAICYAIAGALAAVMGNHLQGAFQKPIFLVSLSFLLALFALNQFNLLHVPVPQIFSHTFHNLQQKQKQGSALGAVVMGAISAVMVSPCVTPALVGALTFIGQTGNAFLGGLALFALALGMGLPLLCVASVGSHLLPKAGPWMGHIKTITGVLLLVLAGSILMRAFPQTPLVEATTFTPIHNESDLQQALATANKLNQPIILDVFAEWCVSCKQLDKEVFADKTVLATLQKQNAKLLRLDLTEQTEEQVKLQKALQIVGPPTLIFFNSNGEEAKNYRLVGTIKSDAFVNHVNRFMEDKKK